MALFEWKDSYSVGLDSIDKQHKMLVDSLNELHEAMLNGEANDVIAGILKGLSDYIGIHFSYEESLMKKHTYMGYEEHKQIHNEFVEKVNKFNQDFTKGKLMLSLEVMNFLKNWLKNHIMGKDKEYGPFLASRGVK